VEQIEPHLAASAQCVALYLQCQLTLHEVCNMCRFKNKFLLARISDQA
jgi:hypothetical protein